MGMFVVYLCVYSGCIFVLVFMSLMNYAFASTLKSTKTMKSRLLGS